MLDDKAYDKEMLEAVMGIRTPVSKPFGKTKEAVLYLYYDEWGYGLVQQIALTQEEANIKGCASSFVIERDETIKQYYIPEMEYQFSDCMCDGDNAIARIARYLNLGISLTYEIVNGVLEQNGIPKISINGTPIENIIKEEQK